jgi:ribosomal-protein-alanine N-acetyltransferase
MNHDTPANDALHDATLRSSEACTMVHEGDERMESRNPVELSTARTRLRELEERDVPGLLELANDPNVTRWVHWPARSREALDAFVRAAQERRAQSPRADYPLAAESRGELVGFVRLQVTSVDFEQAEVGGYLFERFWGQGLATEVGGAVRDLGLHQLRLRRVFAYCDTENLASARVLEKLGFAREGTLRSRVKLDGVWRDSHLYAIVAP